MGAAGNHSPDPALKVTPQGSSVASHCVDRLLHVAVGAVGLPRDQSGLCGKSQLSSARLKRVDHLLDRCLRVALNGDLFAGCSLKA